MDSEFQLIHRYWQSQALTDDVIVGIGDDAAVIDFPADQQLVVCADTLVESVHFTHNMPVAALAAKALVVNLSDMAAMGATPKWLTLALTLPKVDHDWLACFSRSLLATAQQYHVVLIGGDTTQGPLTISIQLLGTVTAGQMLTRSKAAVGDAIYVSGELGDAGIAVAIDNNQQRVANNSEKQSFFQALYVPQPRLALGQRLLGIANSAIDISDGLAADLNHILQASQLGATLMLGKLPVSAAATALLGQQAAQRQALTAGDDYELCFTVPTCHRQQVEQIAQQLALPLTCIGQIEAEPGLRVLDQQGEAVVLQRLGWEHFYRESTLARGTRASRLRGRSSPP